MVELFTTLLKLIEPPNIHNSVKICLFLVGVVGELCYVPCMFCELQ